jgi:hypothetical protein
MSFPEPNHLKEEEKRKKKEGATHLCNQGYNNKQELKVLGGKHLLAMDSRVLF